MNVDKTEIPNPYTEKAYGGKLQRMQGFIGEDDYKFIVRVSDSTGCVRAVVSQFWLKLVTTLKKHGITDYTKANEFVDFIINMRIEDGRNSGNGGTVGGVATSGSEQGPDARGGVAPVVGAHPGDAVQHSVVQSSTATKARRSKGISQG